MEKSVAMVPPADPRGAGAQDECELIERRSEPRQLVREPAILQLLRPMNQERFRVYIMDTSEKGIGVWTPVALQPGALVQIRLAGSVVVLGEVRYTVRRGDEFHAGLRIEDVEDCRSARILGNTVGPDELLFGSVPWGSGKPAGWTGHKPRS